MWLFPKLGERSFLRRVDRKFVPIQPDAGVRVEAAAINDSGFVIGRTERGGFLWRGEDIEPLDLEHPRCKAEGTTCTALGGINNLGDIVGEIQVGNERLAFRAKLRKDLVPTPRTGAQRPPVQ